MALLVVAAGILALLFYVMRLVRPKRVRLSARILTLVEFDVEADGESRELGRGRGAAESLQHSPGDLPEGEVKATPESD